MIRARICSSAQPTLSLRHLRLSLPGCSLFQNEYRHHYNRDCYCKKAVIQALDAAILVIDQRVSEPPERAVHRHGNVPESIEHIREKDPHRFLLQNLFESPVHNCFLHSYRQLTEHYGNKRKEQEPTDLALKK